MTRIRFVSLYYWPDEGAAPRILMDMAEATATAGLDTEVLTSRGRYRLSEDHPLLKREYHEGVRIRRLWSTGLGRSNLVYRILDYVTFSISCFVTLMLSRKAGVLVVVSSPPSLPYIGALVRWLKGGVLVYKVEDLYPDLVLALGMLKPGILARLSRVLTKWVMKKVDKVVVIDEHMVDKIKAYLPSAPIELIPNWASKEDFQADVTKVNELKSAYGITNKFVVLYSGNLGMSHTFSNVIEAAQALEKTDPDVVFVFVGDGPNSGDVTSASKSLSNVMQIPFQPRDQMANYHSMADVILITLRPEADGLVMPSKFYAALAAAKPVLFVGGENNDVARNIREYELGWVVADDAEAIRKMILKTRKVLGHSNEMEKKISKIFDTKFDKSIQAKKWVELFQKMAKEHA